MTHESSSQDHDPVAMPRMITRRWARIPPEDPFPAGDGTADTEAEVTCPYCAQLVPIALDPGSGSTQDYIEDCQVCCRPWRVRVAYRADGSAQVEIEASDEG